jgi:PPP family 3-phenylpropionic acid transporter
VSARAYVLRAYYFTSFAAYGIFMPFFPPWLEARGFVGIAMGAMVATLPAMGIIGPPAFGALADSFGRPSGLLRTATTGTFAAMLAIAVAALLGRSLSYFELFTLILLFAFLKAPTSSLADVVALDLARSGDVSYGRIRLWGSLGFLAGVVFGGRFIDASALAPLPVSIAAGYLIAAITAFALPEGSQQGTRSIGPEFRSLLASSEFRLFLVTSFAAQISHAAYDLCYSLVLRDRHMPSDRIGVAWAIGVVAEVAIMALPLKLKGRAPRALAVAFAGAAIRWALIAVVHAPWALLLVQPLHALTFGLFWIASLEFIRSRAPIKAIGTAQGLFVAATGLGSVVGMLAWGQLYRSLGGGVIFGAASAIALLSCTCALILDVRSRRDAEPARVG